MCTHEHRNCLMGGEPVSAIPPLTRMSELAMSVAPARSRTGSPQRTEERAEDEENRPQGKLTLGLANRTSLYTIPIQTLLRQEENMRAILIVSAMLAGLHTPAPANQCPRNIAALDKQIQQHG